MLYISAGAIEKCAPDKRKIKVICPAVWIHYVVDGRGYYNGDPVEAGQAFIVHKNCLCEYYPDRKDPWTYVWIRLEGMDSENLLKRCGLPDDSRVFSFDYSERLLEIARALLVDTLMSGTTLPYREASAKMILSLHQKTEYEGLHGTDERWVIKAKEYIASNYHKKMTVEGMAADLYIDRKYLRNLFVKYTGMPTKAYLDAYRMERARELLTLKDTAVALIAQSVGYADAFAFSKAFKKHYGITPSEAKKVSIP